MASALANEETAFAAEAARLRESGALGASGRLRELFDFLADRGHAAEAASQAEIGETVFGQDSAADDDATVRVYIHRLRKRLDEFYAEQGESENGRLTIPAGIYALRLAQADVAEPASLPPSRRRLPRPALLALFALVALTASFLVGRLAGGSADAAAINPIWEPILDSERPVVLVVGDYYIFGEIDPVQPEQGRLIRDFSINSPTDLARAQQWQPDRYGNAEDVGLNYLPLSSAYALREIMPILARHDAPVDLIAASEFDSGEFRSFNIVYIGLISGMALLEDVNFASSGFAVGESYDELIDMDSGRSFISEEARSRASPRYYHDYGYVSRFREPGGALVTVIAAARDTGLRGIAPIIAAEELPEQLAELAETGGFEGLFEITGQQGADLSETLVIARPRP